jgi:hypothetical protein
MKALCVERLLSSSGIEQLCVRICLLFVLYLIVLKVAI